MNNLTDTVKKRFQAGKYNIVQVSFKQRPTASFGYTNSENLYNYKCSIADVIPGDMVVIRNPDGELQVVRVIRVLENNMNNAQEVNKAKKFIVDKIDLAMDKIRHHNAQRVKYIKLQLAERKKAYEEFTIYELLAKDDEDTRELLAEYKALTGRSEP